ncbi:MAG: T9SS type A sorting domain-containing protein [candidate division Zixibacteria bacterium]|nr:T9SS type A sorting domain-containing protein [candidate division Zixibacteria bacterium]
MKFGRKILLLIVSLASVVSAGTTDTVYFETEKIIYDVTSNSIKYADFEMIKDFNQPSVPVENRFYHSQSYSGISGIKCTVLKADTISLPFSVELNQNDITTSDNEWFVSQSLSIPKNESVYPANAITTGFNKSSHNSIASIQLFPIQYLGRDKIILNQQIEITISSAATEIMHGLPDFDSRERKETTITKSSSYTSSNGCPLNINFVIVSPPEFVESFQSLLDLKRRSGYNTAIAVTDSIFLYYAGIDEAESLREYLKDFYNTGGQYAILGGDEHRVPIRYAYFYNTTTPQTLENLMICDLYFGDLSGNWDSDGDGVYGEPTQDQPDLGLEILVGRLPFSQPEQVIAYTHKLEAYLFNPGNGDKTYLNKAVFLTSDQMRDYFDAGQQYKVAENFPTDFSADCERLAELPNGDAPTPSGPFSDDVINDLGSGFGMINILAHGRPDGFVVSSSLYNEFPKSYMLTGEENSSGDNFIDIPSNNKVSFYYSIACSQASFDLETLYGQTMPSVVEELLALENKGAVGMIGFTRWGWVGSSYKLMASFYKHLFGSANGNPVIAMQNSWLDYPYYRDQIYGQGYYGDPSITIYTNEPHQSTMSSEPIYHPGENLSLTVLNNNSPMANTQVVISPSEGTYIPAMTDDNGKVDFSIPGDWSETIIITALTPGEISAVMSLSPSIASDADDDDLVLPLEFELHQNYPNPFNPTTTIAFTTTQSGEVSVQIFNILSELVNEPIHQYLAAGAHEVIWNGRNRYGEETASGIYLYRIVSAEGIRTRKMVLIK